MPKAILAGTAIPFALWGIAVSIFMAATAPWEFSAAKTLVAVGGLSMIIGYLLWLWGARERPASSLGGKIGLGVAAGTIAVVGTFMLLRWADFREGVYVKQEAAHQAVNLADPIIQQLLRQSYTDQRAVAAQNAIAEQWRHIQESQRKMAEYGRGWSQEDRLAAAEHMLKEMEIVGRSVGVIDFFQGGGALVLQIAPNTFRITFPVPMFREPTLVVRRAPPGTTAELEEVSRMGATVVFKPTSVPITLRDLFRINPAFDTGF